MTIRIGFTDTFDGAAEFLTDWLSKAYEVERDDDNPEYLFFGDENFGHNNRNFDPRKVTKIFFTGENRRAHNYICHYAISFDHIDDNQHFRLPLYVLNMWHYQHKYGMKSLIDYFQDRFNDGLYVKENQEFACFIQANPNCAKRNQLFKLIHDYKTVNSAGPLFNNVPLLPRDDQGVVRKLDYIKKHKFCLCFENSSYPGYVSEKILEGYIGGSIPIYWGSPTIACDFSTRAFISWHDSVNDDDFMERIRFVDDNDAAYHQMFFEPLLMNGLPNIYMNPNRFLNWFERNVIDRRGIKNA